MISLVALSLALLSGSRSPDTAIAQSPDTACAASVRRFTDALRAETNRPLGRAPRRTRIRSLAREIDGAAALCVTATAAPDSVAPDTLVHTPVDTVLIPVDSTPPDSLPNDSLPSDSLPTDTLPTPQPSGVAELPRAVPTWPAHLATAACTDTVTANLQAALGAARAGDVLCLSGVFRGNFTLPARGDSGWVVLRSLLSPVAPGARVRPSQRADLAMIVASGTLPAITTAPSARGWYVRELEIATDSALSTLTYALIEFATPPSAAEFARDLVLDRIYAHGWPHRPLRRCLALQSASTAIINSWLDECHEKGSDSQAIWGASGPGPFLIENNTLSGAGENVMFGGSDPRFRGVHPSDITIRRNHFYAPLVWRGTWTRKNALELKNAARVLVEANVFDGVWADGQTGVALVFKSTNQSCNCTDCGTRDLTVRRNLIVRAGAAMAVNGKDTNNCSNGGTPRLDSLTRRVAIEENYSDSLGVLTLDTRGVQIYANPSDVLLRRNSWLAPPGQVNAYTGGSTITATRLTINGDLLTQGRYFLSGCWTTACTPGLALYAALVGTGQLPTHAEVFNQFSTLDAALAAGYGVSRATIDIATRGVVVQP